jgi:dienelactone hydrolase
LPPLTGISFVTIVTAEIALIGWSAGGGTVLRTIPQQNGGRPASLQQGDFRAAVAFYPALCSDQ